jgi:pimeloyl-ACP methyl ester carboxylesterase
MSESEPEITWLARPDGVRLAARHDRGSGPGILFLHGLRSDMEGDKARALSAQARARGWEFLRLDLSGHGRSEGAFENGTIGQWRDDALLALDQIDSRPVILVGSSIGGWIALLLAVAHPERIAALLLVAPAPDMTRRVGDTLPHEAREALREHGVWMRPSRYGAPIPITRRMLEDGNRLCVMDKPIPVSCPVRILHGQRDPDVPWRDSLRLAGQLQSPDVETILLKTGDHQLSQPRELALMGRTLAALREAATSG